MLKKRNTQVYAHRGMRSFSPENTLPGYEAMLRVGADWVDIDVVLTRDGEVIASHDPILNPDLVRDPEGRFLAKNKEAVMRSPASELGAYIRKYTIKNLTLSEVRKFDVGRLNPESAYSRFFPEQVPVDGTRIPTLVEVIRLIKKMTKKQMGFQIEMKTDPAHPEYSADPEVFAKALAKIIKSEGILARTEIQAFDFRCLAELRKINPRIKTAFLTSRNSKLSENDRAQFGDSFPKMVKALGGFAWEPEDASLSEAALKEAHALGLKVVVWSWPEQLGTAFDAKLVEKMLAWGVDGIITDDPGRLNAMLAARGMRVPPSYGRKRLK
jgi:glycerophosphoryl diester phosphodiesterase